MKDYSKSHKYIRYPSGFIVWPWNHSKILHIHMDRLMKPHGEEAVSAGYAWFKDGSVLCNEGSDSMKLNALPEDSNLLAKQLGIF